MSCSTPLATAHPQGPMEDVDPLPPLASRFGLGPLLHLGPKPFDNNSSPRCCVLVVVSSTLRSPLAPTLTLLAPSPRSSRRYTLLLCSPNAR
uniref:Uncharacterized protein n=1 Tax=Arundo donax TaxID=35708 RepID=A0A0A9FMW1_ARUDO